MQRFWILDWGRKRRDNGERSQVIGRETINPLIPLIIQNLKSKIKENQGNLYKDVEELIKIAI